MRPTIQKFLLLLILPCAILCGQTSEIYDLIKEGHIRQAQKILLQRPDVTQMEKDLFLFYQGLLSINGDSAVAYYEELLVRHPQSQYADDALFRLGQVKYAQGLYRTAKIRFQRLSIEYPRSSLHQRCRYWIALCHAAVGENDSAAVQFRSVIEDFPTTELTQTAQENLRELQATLRSAAAPSTEESNVRYAIQVGAFTTQNRALASKAYYESEGFRVDLRTKLAEGETMYLVWVGSYKTREEAREARERIKKRYGGDPFIVSERE